MYNSDFVFGVIRELQMAVTTVHGECYNPTEAGSGVDLQKTTTTSVIQKISLANNMLMTSDLPGL